jgi:rhamnosyltransferase
MKIAFIGISGIKKQSIDIRESFVYEVASRLVNKYQYEVSVICDRDFKEQNGANEIEGVEIIYSKYSKAKHAFLFYRDSIYKARRHSDIIYSFGFLGGLYSFLVPQNKALITNIDRIVYKSIDANWMVHNILRLFYHLASKHSDILLCNSYSLEQYMMEHYKPKNTKVIEYGVNINPYIAQENHKIHSILKHYNLIKNNYHLVVASYKVENSIDTIIQGYQRSSRLYPLVIVGEIRKKLYFKKLKKIANLSVIFIHDITDQEAIDILRANATSVIHGDTLGNASHSLLEAMASQNIILAHDNLFNREFLGTFGLYWRSPNELNRLINKIEETPMRYEQNIEHNYKRIITYYNWRDITKRYSKLFKDTMHK